jgi:spermidine synthase
MAVRISVLIFMVGFAASIGQILVIRELLVIFYGNELSTGLILACWLLCTAAGSGLTGRIYSKRPPGFNGLLTGFAVFCAALPATIVWIRASRALWSIPSGELLSPGMMLVVAFCATAPICFLSGGLFALAWELSRLGGVSIVERRDHPGATHKSPPAKPEAIPVAAQPPVYLAESLGGGVGGLIFYFILLPLYPSFAGSLVLVFFLLAFAFAVGAGLKYPGKVFSSFVLALFITASCVFFGYSDRVDLLTRHLQWGKNFFQSRDTSYHNLVFLSDLGQFSLFSNGLWLFSSPDPQSAEPAAHVPLLEHVRPGKVLVLGDYSPELVGEILKHPDVTKVDCVQPDAEAAAFTEAVLSPFSEKILKDSRVRILHMDPRRFMGIAGSGYDVILLSAGEPVNAEMNRFYTVEFFSRVKSMMNPGGQFSFGLPSAPDIVGPREAALLKSLHSTLKEVFGYVLILPGENARFIASRDGTGLTRDPKELIERMRARRLDLRYVRDFYFLDLFNPLRLAYIESIIREGPPAKINRDYEPVCYLYGLGLWGAQLHPAFDRLLGFVSRGPVFPALAGLGGAFLVFVLVLRQRCSLSSAIFLNAGVSGAVLIIVEVTLLLVYQILEGAVYRQMALIISLFMVGLAAGSALCQARIERGPPVHSCFMPSHHTFPKGVRRLFIVQVGLAAYLGALYLLFSVFRGALLDNLGHGSLLFLFSALAFAAGMFGGAQFCAAVTAGEKTRGAGLYAADLIGASAGAVAGSLFLLPALGIPKTLLILGVGCLTASISLMKNRTG